MLVRRRYLLAAHSSYSLSSCRSSACEANAHHDHGAGKGARHHQVRLEEQQGRSVSHMSPRERFCSKDKSLTDWLLLVVGAENPYPTLLEIFAEYMYNKFGKAESDDGAAAPAAKPSTDRVKSSSSSKSTRVDDDDDLPRQFGARATVSSTTGASALKSPISPSSYSTPVGGLSASSSRAGSRPDSGYSTASSTAFGGSAAGGFTSSARPGSASRTGRPGSSSSSVSSSGGGVGSRSSAAADAELVLEDDVDFEEELSSYDARKGTTSSSSSAASRSGYGGSAVASASSGHNVVSVLPFTPVPSSTPLSLESVHRAKSLIFGSSHLTGTFTDPWLAQGFVFQGAEVTRSVPSLTCGLVQHQGGPCGMLAVVQAYVIRELMFTGEGVAGKDLSPSKRYALLAPNSNTLQTALVNSLAEILWLVAGESRTVRCVSRVASAAPSSKSLLGAPPRKIGGTIFKPDGVSESLQVLELHSLSAVRNFFSSQLAFITAPHGFGVVLFLYSVILTRGVENIEKDRDEATSLIGAHSVSSKQAQQQLCSVVRSK